MKGVLLAALLCLACIPAFAQSGDAPLRFHDRAEETRFHALVSELRCVMCQNQSLADSNALVARELRSEVLDLMRQGKSDRQIEDFLVARYGEFVLYKPRVETRTWLLWFGPALLLLGGGLALAHVLRRHRGDKALPLDEPQEW